MILFVFEGEKREPEIFDGMEKIYGEDLGERITYSYGANIYSLFHYMKKLGEGADIVNGETYANHTCGICQPYAWHMSTIRVAYANHTRGICFTSASKKLSLGESRYNASPTLVTYSFGANIYGLYHHMLALGMG